MAARPGSGRDDARHWWQNRFWQQPAYPRATVRLAFVDLETTGLCPERNRITEVGVVTVDRDEPVEWTTLINPGGRISESARAFNGISDELTADAPRFREIAADLAGRLSGRLIVAHNARFDFGFLKAEFRRAGIDFEPEVLCSVMLSRKLYPHSARHDLDTVMQRHGLAAEIRHRALPDARLVWQFWQALHREHPPALVERTIGTLLAGPVLPAHLDPGLIDRLPEAPGCYVMHGENEPLHVGAAANLRRHLWNYFRIDRTSPRALAISHLVRNITWRAAQGRLGAQLQRAVTSRAILPAVQRRANAELYSWRFVPDARPAVELMRLSDSAGITGQFLGIFHSERKARNALVRLAARHGLCHTLLGIPARAEGACTACSSAAEDAACGRRADRPRHLTRAYSALLPLRVAPWPYAGPIGIRERRDVHVVDDWRYVGTASTTPELDDLLQERPGAFDQTIFALLSRTLPHLPRHRIVRLPQRPGGGADGESVP